MRLWDVLAYHTHIPPIMINPAPYSHSLFFVCLAMQRYLLVIFSLQPLCIVGKWFDKATTGLGMASFGMWFADKPKRIRPKDSEALDIGDRRSSGPSNPTFGPWSDRENGHLLALPCIVLSNLPFYWEYRAGNFCYPISVIFWGRYRKEKKTSSFIPHQPPSSIPWAMASSIPLQTTEPKETTFWIKTETVSVSSLPQTPSVIFQDILLFLYVFCIFGTTANIRCFGRSGSMVPPKNMEAQHE